jgi:hypothetical protein
VISIERPGRSLKTGDYRTMRAIAIPNVAPLDLLLPTLNEKKPYLTIGVGDGGNEAGMGNIAEKVAKCIPYGEEICTQSCCDILVTAGVSNWGALAIGAALVMEEGKSEKGEEFIRNCGNQKQILKRMIEAGAYDGKTGEKEESVDGMMFVKEHQVVTDRICDCVKKYFGILGGIQAD